MFYLFHSYAVACNSKAIPEKWHEEQKASTDWYYSFMNRHPNLSLKAPEGMSIARAVAFNRTTVNSFFDAYSAVMEKYSFTADRIYNLDETSLCTVMKPPKVVCQRGTAVASQISRERGATMTFVGIINAIGHYLPPVFIIPRKRWNEAFMRGTLDGSRGILQTTGWMNGQCFRETLEHVKEKSFCSPTNKILLIMDNADCHMTIQAIEYANDNGIVILTLPPHTTNKLQPLDVSVYAAFKQCLKTIINDFNLMHPRTHITEHMLPEFASKAWVRACTPSNVLGGFSATGIWPINTEIFPDEAFLASEVTERPEPPGQEGDEGLGSSIASESTITPEPSHAAFIPGPSGVVSPGSSGASPEQSNAFLDVTPESIRPYPKAPERPPARGRKRVKACILTENEEAIEMLREKEERRRKKEEKKGTKQSRGRPRKKQVVIQDSEEENEEEVPMTLDDSSEYSDEFEEPDESPLFQEREARVGDFVLVELVIEAGRFVGEKIHYVAKVLDRSEESGLLSVSYLRLSGKYGMNDTFYFPVIEDVGEVTTEMVMGVLHEPEKGRTQRLSNIVTFSCKFDGYKIH